MANLVYKGNKANLPATRNATSFYLCEDTRELFFGVNLYTEAVRFFTTTKPTNPAQGVLYIDLADGTGYSWDGSEWKTVIESAQGIKNELIGDADTDTKDSDTIEGAKKYADDAVNTAKTELKGSASDTASSETIAGAKKYADGKATELLGSNEDAAGAATIAGANKAAAAAQAEAEAKVASVTAQTKKGINVDNTDDKNPKIGIALQAEDNDLSFNENGELVYKAAAAAEYTVAKLDTAETGYSASYVLKKGDTQVGVTINIPKDMVVSSGTVETKSEAGAWGPAGTYLHLVLANADSSDIYINVTSLIEYVTSGSQVGDMIVVAVSDDHKVTATVTDGTITLAKLHADVQAEINKAHEHSNKTELDLFQTGDRQKLADAYEAITVGSF